MPSTIDTVLKEKIKQILIDNRDAEDDAEGNVYEHFYIDDAVEEIESLLQSSLEHFAQVVEKEVLESYDLDSWEEWYKGTKKYGGTPEEYIKLIEIQQKAKLKALLAPKKEMKIRGQELEQYLKSYGEPEGYNPYVKLETPYINNGEAYWYGFKCFNCSELDKGHHSKNNILPKGHTKLCSKCFYSLSGIQI